MGSEYWFRLMNKVMALPGAKVDRGRFLEEQLQPHCSDEEVSKAIAERPEKAGISSDLINRLADSCINNHATGAAAISFAAGLPGVLAMWATVPADFAQFFWHVIVLSQKLMYLYGWPSLWLVRISDDDEEPYRILALFTGVMIDQRLAKFAIRILLLLRIFRTSLPLYNVGEQVVGWLVKELGKRAVGKVFPIMGKQVVKWLGIELAEQGVGKVLPILGGIISGGKRFIMMKKMGGRLKSHLESLYFARGSFFGRFFR